MSNNQSAITATTQAQCMCRTHGVAIECGLTWQRRVGWYERSAMKERRGERRKRRRRERCWTGGGDQLQSEMRTSRPWTGNMSCPTTRNDPLPAQLLGDYAAW